MNTITDGCCIIDAICGIDTASPQVGQFTDNFTKIKFIIKKNLQDYDILLLTDADGHVNFIAPDDDILIKSIDTETNETSLLWNIGREITAESTVVIYQIVAYKGDIDNPQSTWYSKEGRLTVTESIDSSSKSASVIGTYPNLLTRLILAIEKCKENYNTLSDAKVDKENGKNLSTNDFSDEMKEKLEGIESGANVNVNPDWNENDENKDSYIKNKPQILTEYDPESTQAMSGKAVAKALAALADSAPETLDTLKEIADALNNDPDFGATIISELSKKANSSDLSVVAKSGRYDDLTGKPTILSEEDVINIHRYHTYPVLMAEADVNGNKIHLTYATKKQISDILDGKSIVGKAENDDKGNKICDTYARKDELVTSYNDLKDKPTIPDMPITVFEYYPYESQIDEITYGCYIYTAKAPYEYSIMVIAGKVSEIIDDTPDGGSAKTFTYRQYIMDSSRGFVVREKAVCDNYPDWSYDWREVPLNDNLSTKDYVNTAIGDVETSLENIIAKYGLGGDSL